MDRSLEMNMRLLFASILLLAIAGCDNDCSFEIAADQIRFADSIDENGKTYYLYTRTTGFQDKIVFFELFDMQPKFDDCEKSNIKPIYVVDYDDYPNYPDKQEKQYIKSLTLQPNQGEKLRIIYTKNKNEGMSDDNVKFSHVTRKAET
jgi:hypothetical protein